MFYCEPMALSEREQRLLAEMEEALSADDPRLVSTLSGSAPRTLPKGLGIGIAATMLGFATLFAGLIAQLTLVGVCGFIIALVGVIILINSISSRGLKMGRQAGGPRRARGSFTQGFTKGMEDRWDQRNNG